MCATGRVMNIKRLQRVCEVAIEGWSWNDTISTDPGWLVLYRRDVEETEISGRTRSQAKAHHLVKSTVGKGMQHQTQAWQQALPMSHTHQS